MKPGDKEKLNQCLEILDTTDLGLSMVWLWTWSTIKENLEGGDWDQLVSEDEAWTLLCEAIEAGAGFTLAFGADQHAEDVLDWMLNRGLIGDFEDLEEDENGTDETID